MWQDDSTLLDIVKAARSVLRYVGNYDRDTFMDDDKTQSAVVHQLLIIGKAVKRLSAKFRSQHPEVPWKDIAGLRDKAIHGYDEVDLDEIWDSVSSGIPQLLELIEPLLPKEE